MLTADAPFHGYSADELRREAEREANKRVTVYQNRVLTGRMTPAEAKMRIRKMRAIAMHFAELAEKERLL